MKKLNYLLIDMSFTPYDSKGVKLGKSHITIIAAPASNFDLKNMIHL